MGAVKRFLTDPSAMVAIVASLVQVLLVFSVPGITDVTAGAIIATVTALSGLVTAYLVNRNRLIPAITGFVQSLIALAVGFGLTLSEEQISAMMALVTVVAGLVVRSFVKDLDEEEESTEEVTE